MDKAKRQRSVRQWMQGLGLGVTALLALPAGAAPLDDPSAWPPPMVVGVRRPMQRGTPRVPWCDFAAHAKTKSTLKVAQDPVFRPLSEEPKAAYAAVRKALLAAKPGSPAQTAAENKLQAMLIEPEGAALARLALNDTDAKVFLPALRHARVVAAVEPRIIGFATQHLRSKDPAVVLAAATLVFAAGCDSPLDFAMDALEQDNPVIQSGLLQLAFRGALDHVEAPILTRVIDWLDAGGGTVQTRVLALRMLGSLGWSVSAGTLLRLTGDADPAVSGEALASLAVVVGEVPQDKVQAFLADPNPLRRAGAIRAIAQAEAMRPERIKALVAPLLSDKSPVADPLFPGQKKPPSVGELAQRALDYAEIR